MVLLRKFTYCLKYNNCVFKISLTPVPLLTVTSTLLKLSCIGMAEPIIKFSIIVQTKYKHSYYFKNINYVSLQLNKIILKHRKISILKIYNFTIIPQYLGGHVYLFHLCGGNTL